MNILILNQSDELIGGSDIYFRDLCQLLRSKGHAVYEFYSTIDERKLDIYPKEVDFASPRIMDVVKYCYNKDAKKKLEIFIAGKKIDIAHLNIYYGKLTSSILSVLEDRKIPIVQTLHEYKLVCPTYKMSFKGDVCEACKGNKFFNAAIKRCNRGSFFRSLVSSMESYVSLILGSQSKIKKFICVSEFQKKKIINMGVNPTKLVTVHNFFPSYKINEFPVAESGRFFLYLGRVEIEKGILVFMELAKRRPNIKFVVVGEGGYFKQAVDKKIKENIKNIEFIGKVKSEEVSGYLKQAMALVVPSLWMETFGLVILEAFNYAKPVIASRQGGMTEIIADKENGLLCSVGDVDGFLEAVDYIANNSDMSYRMGARGYAKVREVFSEDYFYENIIKVYKEVCDE